MMIRRADLTGLKFGRLTAIRFVEVNRFRRAVWEWSCDCGGSKIVDSHPVRHGLTKSCGCAFIDRRPGLMHGHCQKSSADSGETTRTYRSWLEMKARCAGRKSQANYLDRGITVCERWLNDFPAFLADMGDRPAGTSLDRIKNEIRYEPGNCRWATRLVQNRNRRTAILVSSGGREVCLKQACQETGINYDKIRWRVRNGAPPQEAFDRG